MVDWSLKNEGNGVQCKRNMCVWSIRNVSTFHHENVVETIDAVVHLGFGLHKINLRNNYVQAHLYTHSHAWNYGLLKVCTQHTAAMYIQAMSLSKTIILYAL